MEKRNGFNKYVVNIPIAGARKYIWEYHMFESVI